MKQAMRAFISYRRKDAYMPPTISDEENSNFILKLKSALGKIGFKRVFQDVDPETGMQYTVNFLLRLFTEIENCDAFFVVIGSKWDTLREERVVSKKVDIVTLEIFTTIKYQKPIIPILIDGMTMPDYEGLPENIRDFTRAAQVECRSDATVDEIARLIDSRLTQIKQRSVFSSSFRIYYTIFAILIYFCCAIIPNVVGVFEYGSSAWWAMARLWGGLYIWPAVYIPFVLFAFFNPIRTIVETLYHSLKVGNQRLAVTCAAPILLGLCLAGISSVAEVKDPHQVPWTIFPEIERATCQTGFGQPALAQIQTGPGLQADQVKQLVRYDADNSLRDKYIATTEDVPFWLDNKCWPNVLFYLVAPVIDGRTTPSYEAERPGIQKIFQQILYDPVRLRLGVPDSITAYAYWASFFVLVLIGFTGVILSGFFAVTRLQNAEGDNYLDLAVDDAFMCLLFSLITLMGWVPFRMNTEYIKLVYFSSNYQHMTLNITNYIPDILFLSMTFIGYAFSAGGMIARFGRFWLVFYSVAMISVFIALTLAIVYFHEEVARLCQVWTFYIVLAVPGMAIVFVLWFLFSPMRVHFKEFRASLEPSNKDA